MAMRAIASERGQAAVEAVAVLPAVLVAGAVLVQLALAGHAAWAAANAARVAARADAVGRDAKAAARSALPKHLERGLKVARADDGLVSVRLHVPLLLPIEARGPALTARARLQVAP